KKNSKPKLFYPTDKFFLFDGVLCTAYRRSSGCVAGIPEQLKSDVGLRGEREDYEMMITLRKILGSLLVAGVLLLSPARGLAQYPPARPAEGKTAEINDESEELHKKMYDFDTELQHMK